MKNFPILVIAIGIVCLTLGASPTLAVVKKNPVTTPAKTSTKAPLTQGECTKLGGEVHSSATCKSSQMCVTHDENGNGHGVCISKE